MNTYRMKYRPAGYCTLPDGLRWEYVEAPRDISHMRPDLPASSWPFGVFKADRPLTAEERKVFEIDIV